MQSLSDLFSKSIFKLLLGSVCQVYTITLLQVLACHNLAKLTGNMVRQHLHRSPNPHPGPKARAALFTSFVTAACLTCSYNPSLENLFLCFAFLFPSKSSYSPSTLHISPQHHLRVTSLKHRADYFLSFALDTVLFTSVLQDSGTGLDCTNTGCQVCSEEM